MEYYLYISWAKVNLLFSQIPTKFRPNLAAEIGFNIGLFSAKVSKEFGSKEDPDSMSRLSAVTKYIEKYDSVGSIDSPDVWVADNSRAKILLLRENSNVVFFSGITPSGTYYALGGSKAHLTGQDPNSNFEIGWSFLPFLLRSLTSYEYMLENKDMNSIATDSFIKKTTKDYEREWMDLIRVMWEHASGPEIKVQFLAKRLSSGTHPNTKRPGLLATPIYVSQAD